jgi:hypothetical protein
LLSLQRLSGNAAVTKLLPVARQSDAGSEDPDKSWTDAKGPELIQQMAGHINRWKVWRSSPSTGNLDAMPGGDASALIDRLWVPFAKNPALRDKASAEILKEAGSTALTYLQEMVCMRPTDFTNVDKVFNGVQRGMDPGHNFTITAIPPQTAISLSEVNIPALVKQGLELTGFVKFNSLTLHYENNFGWFWTQNIDIPGLSVKLGVSIESGGEEHRLPKLEAGPGPLTIDFNGTVEADKQAPPQYWGWTDFNKAHVVAGDLGPGVDAKVAGAGVTAGVRIPFFTFESLKSLAFKTLVTEVKPSWPTLGGAWDAVVKERPLSLKFSIGSIGTGEAFTVGGPTEVTVMSFSQN